MRRLTIFSYSIPTTSKSAVMRTDIVSAHPCGFQLMFVDPSVCLLIRTIMDWIVPLLHPQERCIEVLIPKASECDLLWNWVITEVIKLKKKKVIRWVLIHCDWCSTKEKFGHRQAQREDYLKIHREKVEDWIDAPKAKGCQRLLANQNSQEETNHNDTLISDF